MNSLNTLGNRQVASLNADLARMEAGDGGSSIQGQITTTLAALSRLVDDYDSMARKEMVTAAREKANTRVLKLKTEHRELKARFERAKNMGQEQARGELLGVSTATGTGHSTETTQRRAGAGANGPPSPIHESPFGSHRNSPYPGQQSNLQREDYALREHTFIRETENSLDQYLAQGRAVLDNLVEQRGILKGARTRLLSAANTLGLSRETIAWIERRTTQDAWIFGLGATFTLFCFWVIWHYLG